MQFSPRLVLSVFVGSLLCLTSPDLRLASADTPAAEKPMAEKPAETTSPAPAPAAPAAPAPAPAKPVEGMPSTTPADMMPSAPKSAVQPTTEELRSVELVNQERVRRGLQPLTIDPTLIVVAREHSREMMDKKYFSHQSPTAALKTPMDRYLKAVPRPEYACVGENLFYCTVVDVQRGHNAFMNSPTHRDNVVFPRYERIGVGVVKNERGEFWITQMYLSTTDPVQLSKRTTK